MRFKLRLVVVQAILTSVWSQLLENPPQVFRTGINRGSAQLILVFS